MWSGNPLLNPGIMKQSFFLAIAPAALLPPVLPQTPYKYIKRNSDASKDNKTYHFVLKAIAGAGDREQRAAPGSTGRGTGIPAMASAKIIDDPIDVYAGDPALINATLTIHFGNFNKSPGQVNFSFYSGPYYDYHMSSYYILVSNLRYSNIHPESVYRIPLHEKAGTSRAVAYPDFVTKWGHAAHMPLNNSYRAGRQGGKTASRNKRHPKNGLMGASV